MPRGQSRILFRQRQVSGILAQGRTVTETLEIARDAVRRPSQQ